MLIGRIVKHIARTRHRRRTSIDLSSLSERQLDDLGIARTDLMIGRHR